MDYFASLEIIEMRDHFYFFIYLFKSHLMPLIFGRYFFEAATLVSVLGFMVLQLGEELKNAGLISFLKNLKASPPKILFVISNLLVLGCIPLRFLQTKLDPEE